MEYKYAKGIYYKFWKCPYKKGREYKFVYVMNPQVEPVIVYDVNMLEDRYPPTKFPMCYEA